MKIVWMIVLLIVAGGVGLVLFGLFAPRERSAAAEFQFKAAPERVYQQILDIEGARTWRADLKEVRIVAREPQLVWDEIPRRGPPIRFTLQAARPSEEIVLTLVGQGFRGRWTGQFRPHAGGTLARFEERPTADSWLANLLGRVFYNPESSIQHFAAMLSASLGEVPAPAPDQ